jgi:hypothetical protein
MPASRDSLLPDRDRPAGHATEAGERVDELRLPVAVDAGEPDDLARSNFERDPTHGLECAIVENGEVLDDEQSVARLRPLLLDLEQHLAADHEPGESALGRALPWDRLDRLPAPEDRDAVGDVEHFVQLVGDEDDGLALGLERPDDLEELLRLLRRQHGRGLVEDENLGAAVERLQDLDALLLRDGNRLDARVRRDRKAELLRQRADALLRRVHVEERPAARLGREDDVLRHRHYRYEHEVLVHHAHAPIDRIAGRRDANGLPVQMDLALVGVVEPVEDVHERRLARAVLAEQGVHLALGQLEVDAVVGDHPREALRDSLQFEERGVCHRWTRSLRGGPKPAPRLVVPPT